jgi:hypothetical protein
MALTLVKSLFFKQARKLEVVFGGLHTALTGRFDSAGRLLLGAATGDYW